ncbi:hypothetical protein [Paenibacillus rigui]|uniref:Uncharacterized protein n=1 Tax=Paenibacillus rigui TaxID=554312 RepID=A0A229UYM0_9BACL|nr:hypothetical protein [Paenibacillus rigui]OXM88331.1 hypothetical protein CF651_00240 [Paenibacillus rigui]
MDGVLVPFGNQTLVVELSLKEAIALSSGAVFYQQPQLAANARKKLRSQVERLMLPDSDKIHYHALEM